MNRLVSLACVFVMMSCGPRGTIGEIDEILQNGNYKIVYEFQGCFGGGTEKLEIRNGKTATYSFFDFSQNDSPIETTKIISWTEEKEKKLKELFEIGIHLQDTLSICTTTARYALARWPNSIEFVDLNCEVYGKFEELVK